MKCLSKIASVLRKPLQCDKLTSSLSRLSYARVLVEVDLRVKCSGKPQFDPMHIEAEEEGWELIKGKKNSKLAKKQQLPPAEAHATTGSDGLNSPLKQHEIVNLLKKNKVDVCVLLETKLSSTKFAQLNKSRLKQWKFLANVDAASTARIVVFWNIFLFRRRLWEDLRKWFSTSPWIIMGDFNSILSEAEKHRGSPVSNYEVDDFRGCCSDLGYTGNHFTWSNGSIWSKIDRVLVNPFWFTLQMLSHVHFPPPGAFSDHSPATVQLGAMQLQGKRAFKFYNMWTAHKQFLELVGANWHLPVYGSIMFTLCKRLKHLKGHLKTLNRLHFSHISERVLRAAADLESHQIILQNDKDNPQLVLQEKHLRPKLINLKAAENMFFSQKLKSTFLKECDKGSSFFHALRSHRHRKNFIPAILCDNGTLATSVQQVGGEFVKYYQSLLGTAKVISPLDEDVVYSGPCLDDSSQAPLLATVTNTDIKMLCSSWSIVGEDLCAAIKDFFTSRDLLKQVNNVVIALIPKSANVVAVVDFRPISYCNVIYKVIAKVLVDRLSIALKSIISPSQNAFLGGRNMIDNINLVFPVHLVMKCVETTSFSMVVNGEVFGFFHGTRGVRFNFHPKCSPQRISHLAFADDILLVSRGDSLSVHFLYEQLLTFGRISGLGINDEKSTIYFGGVCDNTNSLILQEIGFREGVFPLKYLGVPLSPHRLFS
ncbi:uncharacterized protein LOC120009920 [Tripterygium wilfordii]|uniref:uncharacterized protein LOC120009920 n=1 Tax=Tripterygium wilfordii TaxID=458696 RepID=UPI0018F80228|nr:uncharacterized protein LOC120009920 [Tripterygium wilfordii]